MTKTIHRLVAAIFVVFSLFSIYGMAHAQTVRHVRIPVGALRGQGTFVLDFQLLDGAFLANDNSRATVFNLTLTGGTLGTVLPSIGNATGTPEGTPTVPLTLRDGATDAVADFAQEFTVQSVTAELHFDVLLSATVVETDVLDNFNVLILDAALVPLATTGFFGTEIVSADFATLAPAPVGYSAMEMPTVQAFVTTAGTLSAVSVPPSLAGSTSGTGTVRLTANAPTNGQIITLSSSLPSVVSVPASVTVPVGESRINFTLQTFGVATETEVTITAQIGSETRQATVVVQPILESIILEPGTTLSNTPHNGTIRLRSAATQPVVVGLQSGAPFLVGVPISATIPIGETAVTFPVEIYTIGAVTEVRIFATFGSDVRVLPVIVFPAPLYQLLDLGTLGGQHSTATAINGNGQVVGYSETDPGDTHAFVFDGTTLQDLGTLGGQNSHASGINSYGQVVGEAQNEVGDWVSFVSAANTLTPGFASGETGILRAVNGKGQSVGTRYDAQFQSQAVLRQPFGTVSELGTLGGTSSEAFALNEAGEVAGRAANLFEETRAFLFSAGTMQDLGTLGGISSEAYALNSKGTVVGMSELTQGDRHAFVFQNGMMQDLGTLGGQNSTALGINDDGLIVGNSDTELMEPAAALNVQGMWFDLNAVTLNLNEWRLIQAVSINQAGQIAVVGTNNGDQHALRLDPLIPNGFRTITGTIALNGCPLVARVFPVEFRAADNTVLFVQNVQTTSDGAFRIVGVPAGVYRLSVKEKYWLRRTIPVNVQNADVSNLLLTLKGGDANDDNAVDIADLLLLIAVYNKTSANNPAEYSLAVDFNCDNINDITDLLILIGNYNQLGNP